MVFFIIGVAMGIGAMLGAFTSIHEGVGLMLVMGVIGAVFAGAIAGGVCAILRALRQRPLESDWQVRIAGSDLDDDTDIHAVQLMNLAKQWSDEQERFPIAGDPELISRVKSGSPDLTNLNRHNGF